MISTPKKQRFAKNIRDRGCPIIIFLVRLETESGGRSGVLLKATDTRRCTEYGKDQSSIFVRQGRLVYHSHIYGNRPSFSGLEIVVMRHVERSRAGWAYARRAFVQESGSTYSASSGRRHRKEHDCDRR
ncbi:hypothetical protein M408DRAFT_285146 [Serendipita vermifera MAFF 305830]|uniref:Uncharacterized protein n=1 Tax=Serendipita vermifera MAFF 305830 TaxID=933852 RepID=A0A0C2WW65_SERVB|nr:hypothetical protein M408DRAFT_285146 [Serendipita vermifera MAFF 305830]